MPPEPPRRALTIPLPSSRALSVAWPVVTAAAVVAVIVIGALRLAGVGGGDSGAADLAARQRSAVSTATRYAAAFATYDYRHLDRDFAATESHAVNPFLDQYRRETGQIRNELVTAKSRSSGKVLSAGLVSLRSGTAVVDIFLDQTIRNARSAQPRTEPQRVQMTLTLRAGRWLISNVKVL